MVIIRKCKDPTCKGLSNASIDKGGGIFTGFYGIPYVGFECEIPLLIACFYTRQSTESQKIAYAMNSITHDHMLAIVNMWVCMPSRSLACSIYLHACTYSCRSSRMSSILQANCQSANNQPSQQALGVLLIAHPTCSLTSPTSIAKVKGVAGNSQSLESHYTLPFAIV